VQYTRVASLCAWLASMICAAVASFTISGVAPGFYGAENTSVARAKYLSLVIISTSSFVRKNAHGVGVQIVGGDLRILKCRFNCYIREAGVREAHDEFIRC
jgi:hypothetical protein